MARILGSFLFGLQGSALLILPTIQPTRAWAAFQLATGVAVGLAMILMPQRRMDIHHE